MPMSLELGLSLAAAGAGGVRVVPGTVKNVTEGDSITNGLGSSGSAFNYPSVSLAALITALPDLDFTLQNIGTSGITVTNSTEGLVARYSQRAGTQFDPTIEKMILTLMAGTNDGASSKYLDVYRGLRSYLRKARATGYHRRAIGTLISRNSGVAPDGSFDANTLPLNLAIRQLWNSDLDCDGIFDFAANAAFDTAADADNLANYVDKLHPSDGGYAIMGPIHAACVESIIAAPGTRVDPPATFSPFDLSSNLILSNGNRTVAWTSTGFADASVRAFPGKSSGKWYWEQLLDVATTAQVGLVSEGFEQYQVSNFRRLTNDPTAIGWGWSAVSAENGRIVYNGTVLASPGALANGDVIQFALDADAELFWMRKAAGNWNGNPSANPATGVGGFSVAGLGMGLGKLYPAAYIRQNGSQVTSRFASAEMTGTAPSGFFPLIA